jgi:DNA-binding NarL/FixJ family response regulator
MSHLKIGHPSDVMPGDRGQTPPVPPDTRLAIGILIVDDDPRVRQAIGSTIALEADMVTVAEAADARTALAVAEDTKPSVALVDVLLPDDVTGLALVRSLQRPGCEVVAMSVRSGLRAAALAAGAVAFVEKGSDIDAILQAVRFAGSTS